jgi:hypothetical protein
MGTTPIGTAHRAGTRTIPVEARGSAIDATRYLGTASPGTVSVDLTRYVEAALLTTDAAHETWAADGD